jgi:hemerythrin
MFEALKVGGNVPIKNIPNETLGFLRDWFNDHELRIDSEYCAYFKNRGLLDDIETMIQEQQNG